MAISGTPNELLSLIAVGTQVLVRDEEWLVRQVTQTPADGLMVRCIGTSPFVRDTEATFLTELDRVDPTPARAMREPCVWDENALRLLDEHVADEPYLVRISAAKALRDAAERATRQAGETRVTAARVSRARVEVAGGRAA